MTYYAMRVACKQFLGARLQNHIHVRHMNMEADMAAYIYVSMPLMHVLSTTSIQWWPLV